MSGHEIFGPKELFDLSLDLKEFFQLWLKARKGEISKSEKQRLGKMVRNLAEELNILPFRGRLLQYILTRRPTLLPRWTRIPEAVDKVLTLTIEYLTYRCDHVIWNDISSRPENIDEYLRRNPHRHDSANGQIFEIIVRRWLKEVIGKHWINVQRLQVPALPYFGLHGIEIDAFSLLQEDSLYTVSVAEVKWTLTQETALLGSPERTKGTVVEEFSNKLLVIHDHFKRFYNITPRYKEVALIAGNAIPPVQKTTISKRFQESVIRTLSQRQLQCDRENIKLYDICDIREIAKESSTAIRNVIEHIIRIRNVRC